MGPHVPRAGGCISGDHLDLVRCHSQGLGRGQPEGGLEALTHLDTAGHHGHVSKIVQLHDNAGAVRAVDPARTAHMEQGRHAHPAGLAALRSAAATPFFLPPEPVGHGLQALLMTARGDVQTHGGKIVRDVAVHHPELVGIDSGLRGQVVQVALQGPGGLGISIAPHGLAVGVIRVDDLRLEKDVGYAVNAGDGQHHHARRGGPPDV